MKKPTSIVREAYQYVIPQLEKGCGHYFFHNTAHTISVFERVTYLAINEDISGSELEDLQLASIFHDIGFLEQYPKNEYLGSQMARTWLISAHHSEERIKRIENMIMATVLFSKPQNLLESIIQDADLDNIGTRGSFASSQWLLREIREIAGIEVTDCAFWQFTHQVHAHFSFHTKTSIMERNAQKQLNLNHLTAYLLMLGCEVPGGKDHLNRII